MSDDHVELRDGAVERGGDFIARLVSKDDADAWCVLRVDKAHAQALSAALDSKGMRGHIWCVDEAQAVRLAGGECPTEGGGE